MGLLKGLLRSLSYPSLSVYDSYKDAPQNSIFRLPDDDKNIIRFNSLFPQQQTVWDAIEAWSVMVAGTSYRLRDVKFFVYGDSRSVEIVKQPLRKFPHALAVIGKWVDSKKCFREAQIGFIPDEEAREISDKIKEYPNAEILAKLVKIYLPTGGGYPGILIDVALFEKEKEK